MKRKIAKRENQKENNAKNDKFCVPNFLWRLKTQRKRKCTFLFNDCCPDVEQYSWKNSVFPKTANVKTKFSGDQALKTIPHE